MTSRKPHINLVVIGGLDTGKSTTIGHLFVQLCRVDPCTILKNEEFSNQIGKGSFKYAWIFDKMGVERERGLTINNTLA